MDHVHGHIHVAQADLAGAHGSSCQANDWVFAPDGILSEDTIPAGLLDNLFEGGSYPSAAVGSAAAYFMVIPREGLETRISKWSYTSVG